MVSDQEIAKGVETVLRQSDPNAVTSFDGVVQQLEAKLGFDLSHKTAFIRDQINLNLLRSHHQHHHPLPQPPKDHFALQHHPQFQPQHPFPSHFALHHSQPHPQDLPRDISFGQPQNVAVAAAETPKGSATTGVKRRGGAGGLNKVCGVSPELQAIVGEPALPRTEIVKKLWVYIRKHNLQDPSNKRKIVCDDALRVVFETDCTDMFKMNKLLAKHILPIDSTKETEKAKRQKIDVEATAGTKDSSQSLVKISEALAKFLGVDTKEVVQSDAEQRVWEYIKVNQLEDPLNSMVVLCDEKLRELLGCESISTLGVREMLKRHHMFEQ